MIHVYAFAEDLRELPALDGIDGAPLEVRTVDGAAVVSRRSGTTDEGSLRAHALVHGTIVEALAHRAASVLPVRFGESSSDDDALDRAVRERLDRLQRRLARVRGCVEIGLRIGEPHEPQTRQPETGREYMLALQERAVAGHAAIEGLHRELAGLSREARLRQHGNEHVGAYLVPRESLEGAQRTVRGFAGEHPGMTVLCTGPWAPYSFAEEQPA